jgi:hypothetical protein
MIQQQVRKALKDSCFEGGVNNSSVSSLALVHFQKGTNKNKYSLVNKDNKLEPVLICLCVCVCACVPTSISSLSPHLHSLTTAKNSTYFEGDDF